MKQSLLSLAFAVIMLVSCGSDGDDGIEVIAPPLSQADYIAQGNVVCTDMLADLAALQADAPLEPSQDEIQEFTAKSSERTGEAIDDLLGLSPPAEFTSDRERFVSLLNARGTALGRLAEGEDAFDDLFAANQNLEAHMGSLWPACRT